MTEEERAAWLRMKPTKISLSPEAWDAFAKALEEPPVPNERLRRLLNEPSIFESGA
jgi:uncharacterized protein (DUF1778 family)